MAQWLLPTAVCGPEINTNNQPILGSSAAQRHAACANRGIGPWVECCGYAAPSARECAVHRLRPVVLNLAVMVLLAWEDRVGVAWGRSAGLDHTRTDRSIICMEQRTEETLWS